MVMIVDVVMNEMIELVVKNLKSILLIDRSWFEVPTTKTTFDYSIIVIIVIIMYYNDLYCIFIE